MRRLILSGVFLALTSATVGADEAAEAKALIQRFAAALHGALQNALAEGGPAGAVAVCQARAPAIAAELSAASGWQIGRVSLKPRHAALGTPDDWERRVLRQFADRQAAGADPQSLRYAEVTTRAGQPVYRFMQAIPTGEVCLACHGSSLAPAVDQALAAAYPDDQARGYRLGDLRGAFTLTKPR